MDDGQVWHPDRPVGGHIIWTPMNIRALQVLKALGLSNQKIADRMGTTRSSVAGRWWRMQRATDAR